MQVKTVIPKPLLACWHRGTAMHSNGILLFPWRERMHKTRASQMTKHSQKRKSRWLLVKQRAIIHCMVRKLISKPCEEPKGSSLALIM